MQKRDCVKQRRNRRKITIYVYIFVKFLELNEQFTLDDVTHSWHKTEEKNASFLFSPPGHASAL